MLLPYFYCIILLIPSPYPIIHPLFIREWASLPLACTLLHLALLLFWRLCLIVFGALFPWGVSFFPLWPSPLRYFCQSKISGLVLLKTTRVSLFWSECRIKNLHHWSINWIIISFFQQSVCFLQSSGQLWCSRLLSVGDRARIGYSLDLVNPSWKEADAPKFI